MPTYGYRCTSCGHEFERFQKMTDPAVQSCETCGAPVKKMLYPVGISFKGAGFYVNDSVTSASSSEAKVETKKEAASETKSDAATPAAKADTPAKSETKPAAS
jgi:putative FmdB family regulatory protein